MLLLHLVPAAEHIFHCPEAHLRELLLKRFGYLFVADAVAVLCRDILAFGRIEEIEIGFGQFARAMLVGDLVDDGDGELSQ